MPKFNVKGVALITVEVEMTVTATTNVEALTLAKAEYAESKRKGDFVVANSADESHPQECEFHTAEPAEPHANTSASFCFGGES